MNNLQQQLYELLLEDINLFGEEHKELDYSDVEKALKEAMYVYKG